MSYNMSMIKLTSVGYWLIRGLPPILFFTIFWQTRINLFSIYEIYDYHIPFIYLSDVLILLILLGEFIVNPKWLIKELREVPWWGVAAVLFCGYLLASLFWSIKLVSAIYTVIKIIELMMFGLWFKQFIRRYPLRRIFIVLTAGVLPLMFIGVIEVLLGRSLNLKIIGEWDFSVFTPGLAQTFIFGLRILRPYASFPHPNVYGGIMAIFALVWLDIVTKINRHRNNRQFRYSLMIFFLFLLGMLVSFSRAAWIGFLLVVVFVYVFPIIRGAIRSRFSIKFSPELGFFVGLVSLLTLVIFHRLQLLFSWDNLALLRRQELNDIGVRIWQDHLWLGVGINQFIVHVANYWNVMNVYLVTQPVHNIFLLVLSELGLIGAVLWFIVFLLPVVRSFWISPHWLKSIWIVIITTGMVDHYWWTLQAGRLTLFLTLGLTLATMKKNESN
jgi:hypothetical protein